MPAGKYDKRVELETKTETLNPDGSLTPTWSVSAKRWASIEDQSGAEVVRAQKIDATITAVITLREDYNVLTTQDRVVYGSRIFWIRALLGRDDRTSRRGQKLGVTEVL